MNRSMEYRSTMDRRYARWLIAGTSLLALGIGLGTTPAAHGQQPTEGDAAKPTTENRLKVRATLRGHTEPVNAVAFSPNGKTLASGSCDQTVKLWDVGTAKERVTLGQDYILSVAFSPDSKTLAAAGVTKPVTFWDVATGQGRASLNHAYVHAVVFRPDGKTLASGGDDKVVKLWEVATGQERATLRGHANSVRSLAISSDGKLLVSGSEDRTVKLWEVVTGQERATLKGHSEGVQSVAFSPDGRTLASASDDKTLKLWDVATGVERATFRGHTQGVWSVVFAPDGKTLASGSLDTTVKVWDVRTGKELTTLAGHTDRVTAVAFSPDGKSLASASNDTTIKLWDIPARPATQPAVQGGEPARSSGLSSQELDGLWATLARDDARQAYRAMGTLVVASEPALAMLRERLRPEPEPDVRQIIPWVKDLDSDQFVVRQKAREHLESLGEKAVSTLRKTLGTRPSLEVRQQIEQLLAKAERLTPEALRAMRAVEVLEHIGSPEAIKVLETLAKGAEGFRLTTEAQASLDRLNRRMAAGR